MGLAQDRWSHEGCRALVHSVDKPQPWETEAAARGGQKDNSNV